MLAGCGGGAKVSQVAKAIGATKTHDPLASLLVDTLGGLERYRGGMQTPINKILDLEYENKFLTTKALEQ